MSGHWSIWLKSRIEEVSFQEAFYGAAGYDQLKRERPNLEEVAQLLNADVIHVLTKGQATRVEPNGGVADVCSAVHTFHGYLLRYYLKFDRQSQQMFVTLVEAKPNSEAWGWDQTIALYLAGQVSARELEQRVGWRAEFRGTRERRRGSSSFVILTLIMVEDVRGEDPVDDEDHIEVVRFNPGLGRAETPIILN
ncbi:hypothetical protein ONZ45_g14384 [Pleurotus djamor]|nr:hypothetical protein ONZ45_g14384 [Pleurotus djamor]